MMIFIRNKKQFAITIENWQRILKEIEDLVNLPNGFCKNKTIWAWILYKNNSG